MAGTIQMRQVYSADEPFIDLLDWPVTTVSIPLDNDSKFNTYTSGLTLLFATHPVHLSQQAGSRGGSTVLRITTASRFLPSVHLASSRT